MKRCIIFTGQGSQRVGMGKDFFDKYGSVRELFEKANEVLGFDLKRIIFEGSEEELKKTSITQPAVVLVSYSMYKVFKKEFEDLEVSYFAGHSLGEYTAIAAAGVLDILTAIKVVRKRGELMENVSGGGMSAVIGMDKDKILEIISKYNVEAVNFNSPKQIVIAGKLEDLEKAETELKNNGAKRIIRLGVSGAFHSSYMKEIQDDFSKYLDEIEFKDASVPVVCNVDGKEHKNGCEIKECLKMQIASPVLWTDSINYMIEKGVNDFIEFGPSKVLSNLVLQINKMVKSYSVFDIKSLEEVKSVFKG